MKIFIYIFLLSSYVHAMIPQRSEDVDYELWYIELLLSNVEKPFDEHGCETNHRQILQHLRNVCESYKNTSYYPHTYIIDMFNEPENEKLLQDNQPPSDEDDTCQKRKR